MENGAEAGRARRGERTGAVARVNVSGEEAEVVRCRTIEDIGESERLSEVEGERQGRVLRS